MWTRKRSLWVLAVEPSSGGRGGGEQKGINLPLVPLCVAYMPPVLFWCDAGDETQGLRHTKQVLYH